MDAKEDAVSLTSRNALVTFGHTLIRASTAVQLSSYFSCAVYIETLGPITYRLRLQIHDSCYCAGRQASKGGYSCPVRQAFQENLGQSKIIEEAV